MEQKNTNTKKYTCEYPTDKNIFTQIDKLKEVITQLEEYAEEEYRDYGFNDIQGFIDSSNDYINFNNEEDTKEDKECKKLFGIFIDIVSLELDYKKVA